MGGLFLTGVCVIGRKVSGSVVFLSLTWKGFSTRTPEKGSVVMIMVVVFFCPGKEVL